MRVTERRAVITGCGIVTPLGDDAVAVTGAIRRGESAVAPVRSFDASGCLRSKAAEVPQYEVRPYFRVPKAIKLTDHRTRLAVTAAARAVADAALPSSLLSSDRTGVVIGTSGSDVQIPELTRAIGGDLRAADDTRVFGERILGGLNPLWLLVNLPNMVSAHVSIQLEARGPNSTVMTDWVAGLQAISEAAAWVEEGEADVVIAGGADTGVLPLLFADYEQAGMFDDPEFILADAAAIFVIEERDVARGRGAQVLAEIVKPEVREPRIVGERVTVDIDRNPIDSSAIERALGFPLAAAAPVHLALLLAGAFGGFEEAAIHATGLNGLNATLHLEVASDSTRARSRESQLSSVI